MMLPSNSKTLYHSKISSQTFHEISHFSRLKFPSKSKLQTLHQECPDPNCSLVVI
uniref:Uncharacterized protein n=1 Tax=Nelumbo nucifera TaxID=4432 RepID=A0A822XVB2_NELNU|nr:TPA_asm: hypothetical protein HUJ06_022841 [Nelumbo nucifera]